MSDQEKMLEAARVAALEEIAARARESQVSSDTVVNLSLIHI